MSDQKPKTLMPFPPMPKFTTAFFISSLLVVTGCQKNDITGMYNPNNPPAFVRTGYFPMDLQNYYSMETDMNFMFQSGGRSSRKELIINPEIVLFSFSLPMDIKNPKGEITLGNTNKSSLLLEAGNLSPWRNYLDPDFITFGTSIDLELRLHSNPEYNFELPIKIPSEFNITQFSRELRAGDTIKWDKPCEFSENGIFITLELSHNIILGRKTAWLPADNGYFIIPKSFIQGSPKNTELHLTISRINIYYHQLLGGRKSVGAMAFTNFYRTVHIPE